MRAFRWLAFATILAAAALLTPSVPSGNAADTKPAATAPEDVAQHVRDVSVMIRTNRASGSGVLVVTKDGTSWVWTAGHVVEDLRSQRESVVNGSKKTLVEFEDPTVIKVIVEDGRTVGKVELFAEVIRYSGFEHGEDLALLRVRSKQSKLPLLSSRWYLDKAIPKLDTDLYHGGSPLGYIGADSVIRGNITAVGRLIDGRIYDQSDVRALPGSSGGGLYLKSDGRVVGLVVRGSTGGSFILHVPVRRILDYAKRVGVDFTLDPTITVPDEAKLRSTAIEE